MQRVAGGRRGAGRGKQRGPGPYSMLCSTGRLLSVCCQSTALLGLAAALSACAAASDCHYVRRGTACCCCCCCLLRERSGACARQTRWVRWSKSGDGYPSRSCSTDERGETEDQACWLGLLVSFSFLPLLPALRLPMLLCRARAFFSLAFSRVWEWNGKCGKRQVGGVFRCICAIGGSRQVEGTDTARRCRCSSKYHSLLRTAIKQSRDSSRRGGGGLSPGFIPSAKQGLP